MTSPDVPAIGFKTVVVGVDGREGGREAIALARRLLEPEGRLILAAVARPRGSERLAALLADADRRAAAQMLCAEAERLDIPASTVVVVRSSIADGLHSVVAEHDADLLVVGSAHRGTVGRVLLGDDAQAALDGASCAVAVAPRGGLRADAWRTIAVGDDGSAESAVALSSARRLAARLGATVRACAVVGPSSLRYREVSRADSSDAIARREFAERRRLERYAGVEADVLRGDPGEALAELSDEVDLIMIGSRGQGPWGRLITGSTGAYLARHASCPVLILPRGLAPSAAPAPDGPSQDPHGPAVAAS